MSYRMKLERFGQKQRKKMKKNEKKQNLRLNKMMPKNKYELHRFLRGQFPISV
jgi:hypothetical protein